MKKKGTTNRKRILIYYTLAIVIPCMVLGFLAFRGIKNDQALLQAELRKNLSDACQQIILETDAYISSVENSFDEIISSIDIPRETIFTDSMLNRFCARHQAVAGILFIPPSGIPSLLNNRLLYVPDGLLTIPGVTGFQAIRNVIEKGWQFEFKEKNFLKALKYYQSILPEVAGKEPRGEILNAIARLQKKTGQFAEALQTYDRIWNDYPQVFIQKKIPLGAVALLEKSLTYLLEKDTIPALETNHLLMCKLQKPEWELGYSQYIYFRENIDEMISLCESSHGEKIQKWLQKIHCIKDSLSMSEKHTEGLLALLGKSEIFSEQVKPDRNNNNTRHKIQINGESFFFPLVRGNDHGQWGIIMDTKHILNITVHNLILKFAEKLNFSWEVTGVNGNVRLKSEYIPEGTSPVYAVFPADLPSYTLALYPEDSGLFVSLFNRGKSIFFYIFVVITIILVCGLFFTLQTINNELNLSRMKSTFMSTVSHEFKSPLTSIRQMAEMLVRGRVSSPERQQKYYATILQQSERLSHLINNILDFSKIEEGQKVFRFEKAGLI